MMRWSNLNKTHLAAITVVVVSGLIGATPFLLDHYLIEDAETSFNSSVTVLEESDNRSLGINADRNLEFGRLKTGSNATKFVNVSIGKRSILKVDAKGNISEILEYDESMYVHGNQEIEIEAKGREPGYYEGELNLDFYIPRSQVGTYWLDIKHQISGFYSKFMQF